VLWESRPSGPGTNDVLVGGIDDAESVYMSFRAFDAATGQDRLADIRHGNRPSRGGWFNHFQPRGNNVPERYLLAGAGGRGAGLLDDAMFIRSCWWTDGRTAGHLLVFRGARTWGVRCYPPMPTPTVFNKRTPYELSAWAFDENRSPSKADPGWSARDIPMAVRAMVLAGETLFVAGPPDKPGPEGGLLWAFSAPDGKKLAEYSIDAPPVWDGMAAANGRLYIATRDGMLVCMGSVQ
jgi:hypothetical protein